MTELKKKKKKKKHKFIMKKMFLPKIMVWIQNCHVELARLAKLKEGPSSLSLLLCVSSVFEMGMVLALWSFPFLLLPTSWSSLYQSKIQNIVMAFNLLLRKNGKEPFSFPNKTRPLRIIYETVAKLIYYFN